MSKESKSFTAGQWLTLIAIGSVHFSSSICISLQAPFYPAEAEKKGATATEYGLVFGSFELVAFLSSPIFGHYIDSIGTNFLLSVGMLLNAGTSILFGFLDYITMHDTFIAYSFLLRILESLGATGALIAAFSLTAACFPDSVATTFATLEVFYGLGYIVGPTIGAFLFSVGGFKLPFFVIGIATMIIAFVVILFMPPVAPSPEVRESKVKILNVLKVPAVFLDSAAICAASSSMGFYTAVLEPHLRDFNITPLAVGFMFIISGGTYACIAPFIGRLCDSWASPKKVMIFGCLFIMISFILVGPLPYSCIPKTLIVCITGLVIHGLGLSCIMVPTFIDALRSSIEAGYPDDISTYGVLSGLWSSSFSLGAFVGPSIAGYLFDHVGFQYGTLFIIITQFFLFVTIVLFVYRKPQPRSLYTQLSEETQLLSNRRTTESNQKSAPNAARLYHGVTGKRQKTQSFSHSGGPSYPQSTSPVFQNPNAYLVPRMPRRFAVRSKSESGSGYDCI